MSAIDEPTTPSRPLAWVPTAYLAEGIPYAMVIWCVGTMFKDLGHTDGEITVATAAVGIAWSLKPLWAAFLDMYRSKRFFVVTMELLVAVVLAALALALPLPGYFQIVVAGLWVLAFASATHDICVDGIYVTALDHREQSRWMGVQGMCWNVGRVFATAALVGLAGWLQRSGEDPIVAWMYAFGLGAVTMAMLAIWHRIVLPLGAVARAPQHAREVVATFVDAVRDFFRKDAIWGMLLFVFLYRAGEGFLLVEAPLFMQARTDEGGLGLDLTDKSLIDGTVGTIVSVIGGLLGGAFVARYGLRRVLLILALAMNVPHLCFVALGYLAADGVAPPLWSVYVLVSVEKLGYSFGFIGNMLYMMQQIAPGRHRMTHYAFATALMNLVLVPTQMASGPLADWLGYRSFFVFVMIASIPSVLVAWRAPFPVPTTELR
jgi:PAT family beta-lactamase induction signal transducer AmpG